MGSDDFNIIQGDALEVLRALPSESVAMCVTSPPYWGLRDYGIDGQLGLEPTPDEYVARMTQVFSEVRRVLRDDGTLWVNIGDSYCATTKGSGGHNEKQDSNAGSWFSDRRWSIPVGMKPKDLVGIPWSLALSLRADGWYLRSDIIWHKPNPMPESVTDRPTKSHEYLFMLSKSERYFYDAGAIAEPGSGRAKGQAKINRRTVWTIVPSGFDGAHFATYPVELVEPCILAGSRVGDVVIDPFTGSGTTGLVALRHGRKFVGIELNPNYCDMARRRIAGPLFAEEIKRA